ncbi:MAG: T9SS type A sorting domain-containing protein [Candidatus Krumholzibacteria bacterium]|nr:T9SS type A sorting domain-containing protein [Candidatus Krumholzibacteria bacterium]
MRIRTSSTLSILVALSALGFVGARASVYYADAARPDDSGDGLSWGSAKQTIQAAIGASAFGDTILVKYGSYAITTDIVIDSTRVLTSDDGTHDSWDSAVPDASLCVVSPTVVSRVFTVTGAAVTSGAHLRGFKITGGNATGESPGSSYGGGIYVGGGADPAIEECWITGNRAMTSSNGYGGGIACRDAGTDVVIRDCVIDNNIGSTGWVGLGGGIYLEDAGACQVYGNSINDNTASTARIGSGGGIATDNTDALIWSNTISNNAAAGPSAGAGGDGGGVYVYQGNVEIWDNVITYNHAAENAARGGDGGGIYFAGTTFGEAIIVRDNPAISYNTASLAGLGNGGGIMVAGPYAQVYGNAIVGNIATSSSHATASNRVGKGGAVCANTAVNLTGNLISGNTASLHGVGYGGGLYYSSMGHRYERNIFAFNTASTSAEAGYGGACWSGSAGSSVFANNTLYRNANVTDPLATGTGSGLHHDAGGAPAVRNNIFAGHDVANSDSVAVHFNPVWTITYNCFHENPGGNTNANVTSDNEVLADPRLTNPAGGDFSLMYDSPCIEEGDPATAVPENGAWVVDIGAIEYTGTRHWRVVSGTGELLFGGRVKAKVDVTSLGTLSEIDMVVHPGEHHYAAPVSVQRWYAIDHVGTGMTFDLTLSYLEGELGAREEPNLAVWRWTGAVWEGPKSTSAANTAENWLTVAGQTAFSDWVMTDMDTPTGVGDIPSQTRLFANYPNPFNPTTTIAYELATPSHVDLTIFNAAGQLVRVLVDSARSRGPHRANWDGRDHLGKPAASGVYFYRLRAGGFEQTRKMILLK